MGAPGTAEAVGAVGAPDEAGPGAIKCVGTCGGEGGAGRAGGGVCTCPEKDALDGAGRTDLSGLPRTGRPGSGGSGWRGPVGGAAEPGAPGVAPKGVEFNLGPIGEGRGEIGRVRAC